MKKIIFTFIVFAFLANVSAQLKVNSLSQVGIGTASPQYKLHVVGDTYVTGNIYIGSTSNSFYAINNGIAFKSNNSLAGFTGSWGNLNVSFGFGSLISTSAIGTHNTSVGLEALRNNTDGKENTANGCQALISNLVGSQNTANGAWALYANQGGNQNTAIGHSALHGNTGSQNTANGFSALSGNNSGNYNTASGYIALCNNTVGHFNTAIGYNANVSTNNLSNTIAIGYNAIVTASNQVRLGNYTVTSVGSSVNWSVVSDGRTKKNIRSEVPGLAFVNLLQPVMYNLDLDALDELQKSDDPKINALRDSLFMSRSPEEKEIEAKARANKEKQVYSGFIAQDVEEAAHSVGYDFSGVDAPENGKGAYGLRYAEFVVPLVKAVQELSEQNDRLQEAMKEQQGVIDELIQKIEKLEENTPVINLRSKTEENTVTDLSNAITEQCKLYQNAPNPFNQSTQIKYYLPQDVKTAYLCIYNLQGTQIKQIQIIQRGEGSQWISGSELAAGMYLYALIVDGKEVDTKRMILTK